IVIAQEYCTRIELTPDSLYIFEVEILVAHPERLGWVSLLAESELQFGMARHSAHRCREMVPEIGTRLGFLLGGAQLVGGHHGAGIGPERQPLGPMPDNALLIALLDRRANGRRTAHGGPPGGKVKGNMSKAGLFPLPGPDRGAPI